MHGCTQVTQHGSQGCDEAAVAGQSFRGEVVRPGDASYDEVRRVWNGMIDKHPALIARCSGTADVMAAVNFARDHNLPLSVRGGGHNVAGRAVCDDGLVVDLSPMRAVRVDPVNRIVQVQGGAILGDIDHETQAFDLAVPLGLVTATGVAGLTLHGGMGWLTRKYGLTLDSLIAADVVTADGHLLRASDTEHPDLFWAIRGGGGNFGVVTTFEFLAYPVGPDVWFLATIYPISQARRGPEVPVRFHDRCTRTPGRPRHAVERAARGIRCPGAPGRARRHSARVLVRTFRRRGGDPPAAAGRSARPIADLSGPRRYLDVQKFFDADYPDGMFYYWKSAYLKRVDDEVIDALIRHAQTRPSPLTSLDLWFLGGAMNRVAPDKTAYARRDARYSLAIESNWTDPEQSDVNIAWSREVFDDMQRFSRGAYLNFPGFVEDHERLLRDAYGPNLDRLREIKARYDPDNLFQGLLNIPPAG